MASNSKILRRISETDQMPSLFDPSENEYDKYAACLAATEGLRRIRDRNLASDSTDKETQKRIATQYVQNCGKVLRSLGMSIGEFNSLGKEISKNEQLKEKVSDTCLISSSYYCLVSHVFIGDGASLSVPNGSHS